MKPVVGLTGILGSGKSSVAERLRRLGACIVDMDDAGRWAVEAERVRRRLRKAFGAQIFDAENQLLRKKLGDIVFSDSAALAVLNSIVHPVMLRRARSLIKKEKTRRACLYIVVDAALLFELDFEKECDLTVTVAAPIERCLERAEQSKKMTRQQALDRIHAQMAQDEKTKRSDYVILNDKGLYELEHAVAKLHEWIMRKMNGCAGLQTSRQ
ncbi:dephospho-CoA kinase [candidate division KSB1 bacterium]|nr:dephospho-CoA kinase [candidate division KSB1 bacterium]RQW07256.1 MAG: dephospho-CoA kinase [candidate division KSB1 bacterium]